MHIAAFRVMIALLAVGNCPGVQAQTLPGGTVDSLLSLARANNPDFNRLRREAEAAGERVAPAGAWPEPRLRGELMDITRNGEQNPTLSPNRAASARYTLMQEIPWYGKSDLKRAIARHEADAASGRAADGWSEIAARIKSLHAQRYFLARNHALTGEMLDLLRRLERIARSRYASGLAMQQDVIRAQMEQSSLRNDLIAIESEQRNAALRTNALLGRPAPAELASPSLWPALPAPEKLAFAALEARLRASSPLLAAEAQRVQAAEKARALTYKNRYPDFTVGVAPNQRQNQFKEWDLMVEVSLPLQQSNRRAQEREAAAMLAASQAGLEATTQRLLADLAENLSVLNAARQAERLSADTLLPQAELSLQAALAGYENGKLDFAILLDAQRQIRQARINQLKAALEARLRLAEIERLLGEDL
ncbi:MAG TPA: TolC family protein [Accumulibacter sp.]|nr:TolC family protein [Accumulibacter sp.]